MNLVGWSRKFLFIAFLTAMIHAIDTGQWKGSRLYALVSLRQMPETVARSPLFQRYLVKSLVGSNRFLLALVSLVERTYAKWSHLRPPRYLEIG